MDQSEILKQLQADAVQLEQAFDRIWLLVSSILIFFMQAGFALVEAGTVQKRNSLSILSKNLLDGCVSALAFYITGFAIAFGNVDGGFMGSKYFFGTSLREDDMLVLWIYNYSFSSTCTTIVSGSTAERSKITHYLLFSGLMSGLVCPMALAWTWGGGWLHERGFHDFAGSMVIHGTGGLAGLVATKIMGPRPGVFTGNFRTRGAQLVQPQPASRGSTSHSPISHELAELKFAVKHDIEENFKPHNVAFIAVGTIILWTCWLFFNGSTSHSVIGEKGMVAEKAIFNSIMGASGGGMGSFVLKEKIVKANPDTRFKITAACNGVLAGLVSINSGCDTYDPWAALLLGLGGSIIYSLCCRWMEEFQVDDPLEAFMVHGACGIYGVLIVAFFDTNKGIFYGGSFDYIGTQILGCVAIGSWSISISYLYYKSTYKGFFRSGYDEVIMEGNEQAPGSSNQGRRIAAKSRAQKLKEFTSSNSNRLRPPKR